MKQKVIGILGGMGPEATAMLYRNIIARTPARNDQEHLHVIINGNPAVPDRTSAILSGGESPVATLVDMAQSLERAGADFMVVPCNTAHYFMPEVLKQTRLPFVSMIEATVAACAELLPNGGKVGLLATSGTQQAGVYSNAFAGSGMEVLTPDDEDQQLVMDAIYKGIKAGDIPFGAVRLMEVAGHLIDAGAELIIGGCTEVPLALGPKDLPVPFVDTLDVLARAAVAYARSADKA